MFSILLCVGIGLADNVFFIKDAIKLSKLEEEHLFDLYLTLASIIGTFLGLYFAAVSIIAQTIYAKVNGEIKNLLNSIRLSNIYVQSIIFLLAFLLISVFLEIHGVKIATWNFYIVCVLSFVSLISFWELASYVFMFFNPANLIQQYIWPAIYRNIELAANSSLYKHDVSFQKYLNNATSELFDTYDSIVEFALRQELIQEAVINNILDNSFNFMSRYILFKSGIPLNSYWYPQRYQFKKYISCNISDLDITLKTGTGFPRSEVHEHLWFEKRIIFTINKCLASLYQHQKYESYYKRLINISSLLKLLQRNYKTSETLYIWDNLYNPFKAAQIIESDNPFYVYIADAYVYILIELILSVNTNLMDSLRQITTANLLKKNFFSRKRVLPSEIQEQLELLQKQLIFEKKVAQDTKTANWYVQKIISERGMAFYKKLYNDLIRRSIENIDLYSQDSIVDNNPSLSTAVFSRAYELSHKLEHSLTMAETNLDNRELFDTEKSALNEIKNKLLVLAVKTYPSLKITDETLPDNAGIMYITLYKELLEIVVENKTISGTSCKELFAGLVHITQLQVEDLKRQTMDSISQEQDARLIAYRLQGFSYKTNSFFIDLMDLSGYVFLFDDVYEQNLKEQIIPIWDKLVQHYGIKNICDKISTFYSPSLWSSQFTALDFRAMNMVENKLQELDLLWQDRWFGEPTDVQPDRQYSSKLLEKVCRCSASHWKSVAGHIIFIVLYLLDKCDANQKQQLLQIYKITSLHEDLVDDEN